MTLFAMVVSSNPQNFATSYNDKGSSADSNVQFWTVDTMSGRVAMRPAGDVCEASPSNWIYGTGSPLGQTVLLGGDSGEVSPPSGFTQVWTDTGSGADLNGTIWAMTPPTGYTALGHVITFSSSGTPSAPDASGYYCVRSDLVTAGQAGAQIWNTVGSDPDTELGVYELSAAAPFVDVGTFIAVPGTLGPPAGVTASVLQFAAVTWL